MRKAFTLIELLVVIAIIAILAAILFPVFAQAKAAAKGAASISNTKQHVLAAIMYAADNEDYLPLATAWNTGNDPLSYGAGLAFSSWGWSVQPYMKSGGLFNDPLASPNAIPAGFPADVYNSYYTMYGYNFTYLSEYDCNPNDACATLRANATSATAPASPTQTVMFSSKWANAENQSGFDWGVAFGSGWLLAVTVDGPNCQDIPEFCTADWGTNNGFYDDAAFLNLPTVESGNITGGASARSTNKHVVGWVDGHANKIASSALAAGTNFTATMDSADMDFTDQTQYLWDLQ